MKKSTTIGAVVIVVLAIILIAVFGRSSSNNLQDDGINQNGSTTIPVVATETTKISSNTSKYQNAELGFAVNYPSTWEAESTNTGVSFIMPIDKTQVSTVAKLEADINVSRGKCAFPPVTTIKDRGTLAVGSNTLNMITMSNTVQGRSYFNRMYSLQQGNICYIFAFSFISQNPDSKSLSGSNLTQAQNNNKAIMNSSDTDFTNTVKSFAFVQGPAGEDETQAAPINK